MGLSGNLQTMSLPEVLEWASNNTKTGTLKVVWTAVEKRVVFRNGKIHSSSSNDPREFLGQFLVGEGLVTEEQLFRALLLQESEGALLGTILVESGILDESELRRLLKRKARETIYSLFLWTRGEFEFIEGDVPETPVTLDLTATEVIFEGVRRVDEWSRLKQLFPTLKTSFRLTGSFENLPEDPIRRKVLQLASGGRTLEEISLEIHRSDFDTACLFRELYEAGLVAVDKVLAEPPPSQRILAIKGMLDQGEKQFLDGKLVDARRSFENVIYLDRLNQRAKKGLMAVSEAETRRPRHQTASSVITLDSVPMLRGDLASLTQERLDPREGFLLSRVNGEWSVRSILKVCPMAEEDALELLAGLVSRQLIAIKPR
jgi:hypothetical protein